MHYDTQASRSLPCRRERRGASKTRKRVERSTSTGTPEIKGWALGPPSPFCTHCIYIYIYICTYIYICIHMKERH